jgi:hypothetical protein
MLVGCGSAILEMCDSSWGEWNRYETVIREGTQKSLVPNMQTRVDLYGALVFLEFDVLLFFLDISIAARVYLAFVCMSRS